MKWFLRGTCLVVIFLVIATSIWFYLTHFHHQYRFESAAIRACKELQHGREYTQGLNTFDDGILSKEIIEIFLSTENRVSKELGQSPKIIYWQDEETYPGLVLVWQREAGFVCIGVFNANDNDSIYVATSKGTFTLSEAAHFKRDGKLSDINTVIQKDRVTRRYWRDVEDSLDWVAGFFGKKTYR